MKCIQESLKSKGQIYAKDAKNRHEELFLCCKYIVHSAGASHTV